MIGIAIENRANFEQIKTFLGSAGYSEVMRLRHPYDADMVRREGGLVVHIDSAERPNYVADITPSGITCIAGDYVLRHAINPMDYLPRLVTMLSGAEVHA